MKRRVQIGSLGVVLCAAVLVWLANGHATETTVPPSGIRENTPAVYALTNARIVVKPGTTIANGTLVIRDGVIESIGESVSVPGDAYVFDCTGKTIYPGFIDAYAEAGGKPGGRSRESSGRQRGESESSGTPSSEAGATYWNPHILPQTNVATTYSPDDDLNKKLRGQGITLRLIAPKDGIISGTSALVGTGDGSANTALLKDLVALHAKLQPPPGRGNRGYPDSPMGAVTLVRQAFYDAQWYADAWTAYNKAKADVRPERNDALATLQEYMTDDVPVVIDAPNELYFLRADQVGREFGLNVIAKGSGREYRRLDAIKSTGRAIIVPLNFPEAPNVKTPEEAMAVSLEDLMHWDVAPENPRRLAQAGVAIAFTSDGLKDVGGFLGAVQKAVKRGLAEEAALRALTVSPAMMFGVLDRVGTLERKKIANLVITDGPVFEEDTEILETWVNGQRFEIKIPPFADARGTWTLSLSESQEATDTVQLTLKGDPSKLSGSLTKNSLKAKLQEAGLNDARLGFSFQGDSLGWSGVVRMSGTISGEELIGSGIWSDGGSFQWTGARTEPFAEDPDTAETKGGSPKTALFAVNYPLGAFGVQSPPVQEPVILFKNATVWTCGPAGTLDHTSVLVRNGKIAEIGPEIPVPGDARMVDLAGKHLTPGIIDCHSHIASDGGINESGQTITAEVRIADFIDCNQISIYRQLAGGTTSSNILHGSANTIGGQNQIIKLRWGSLPEEIKFEGAPEGIKFALGENVKQSNWGDEYQTRYPQSRMGVEQIVRDEFEAARDYEARWAQWSRTKRGTPPRRDLELDAIVEVLNGERWIHCHSYRQDEILALMRTCEDYNVRIATLQHILEGYKVADAMAKHGTGGSSFSDWWAYKIEVYDAIPYNGALMHDAGVVASFNSDDAELGARLNLEAAKAIKYGGLPEDEALKFVTLNPAKQLGIESRVGSIEVGKDADLAVWNNPPMSTYTLCEQTWIDGRKYFDRAEDRAKRKENLEMRAALIQRILDSGESPGENKRNGPKWPRYDVFCGHCNHQWGEER